MIKKLTLFFMLTVLIISICSCNLASEEQIVSYAKKQYGKCELIRTENISDKEIICYLEDAEYGFEYQVSSKVEDISFDGAKFGETESKYSDFNSAYYAYVTEQIGDRLSEMETSYGVDIITSSKYFYPSLISYSIFAEIYYQTGDLQTAPKVSQAVNDLYKSYDKRDYWKNNSTDVYDVNGNRIGKYDLEQNIWMTTDMEEDYFYIEQAHILNPEAVYIRKEEKKFKDTGIPMDDVTDILGNEMPTANTIITYYYFEVDEKEFFLANIVVNPNQRWHTNYYEILE